MDRHRFARPNLWLLVTGLAVVGLPATGAAEPPPRTYEVESYFDLAYYEGEDADPVRHKLDMFLPKGAKGYPVVVILHGGAWLMGNKSLNGRYTAVGRCFASQGIGAVLPNYRLSPAVKHPEHVKDAARAFAWTHQNIARYGGLPEQIVLCGHSAGGHLAALLATDESYLKAHGLGLANIKGVIGASGVYRIPDINLGLNWTWQVGDVTIEVDGKDVRLTPLRVVFGSDAKMRQDASPIHHVRPGLPPFLLMHGSRDLPRLPQLAKEFATALKEAGCEVEALEFPGRGHWTILFVSNSPDESVMKTMVAFIDKHTRSATRPAR
jgi:acetyl esterase/lipase